ncbi:MAG TPA: choline/ethanolamine kinase family protein [Candidatus Limnocylindrales bacterium]
MTGIEAVVAAMPTWAGRRVVTAPIAAGLTNANYRVEVEGHPYFVRVPGPGTELLAVDRANEAFNTRAAAEAGAGATVVAVLDAPTALVLEWLPGRTMSNAAFQAPGMPDRIAAVLHRLHAGPRFRDDFDMVALARFYLGVVDERAIRIPEGYRDRLGAVERIGRALATRPVASVPCHNDLLAENYLDDGERLWIVDYEFSGNNDPTFELGNTAQELGFDGDRQEALALAYFGEIDPAILARMRLQMVMSDVGWTLWAAIQARISTIDFDFWGWAVERWDRAEARLAGPDLDGWLDLAANGPGGAGA